MIGDQGIEMNQERIIADLIADVNRLMKQLASAQDEIKVEEKRFNDLSDDYAEAQKQIVLLRTALVNAHEFIGDSVESYETAKQRIEALAATEPKP